MNFKEKWFEAVKKKNSVLCAGLDPADFEMGRKDEGISENKSKLLWAIEYIKAVAPYCAAIKPNINYWKGEKDSLDLNIIYGLVNSLDMVVIEDAKLADIGSTNDAGMFYAAKRADAITLAPFAGNMKEAAEQASKRELGLIGMCLMSNPEYRIEKNKLVQINPDGFGFVDSYSSDNSKNITEISAGKNNWTFLSDDVIEHGMGRMGNIAYTKQYIKLACDAKEYGLDGIVIGAPSDKNHITKDEIKKVRYYAGKDMLVLLPGVGKQGGEAGAIWEYFDKDKIIVNVGRSLMFPNGSNSTPKEQAETAKYYRDMLNKLRVEI